MWSSSCSVKSEPPAPARSWRALLALACLLVSGLCSAASWREDLPQAVALGEGELRWLGLPIYRATLWAQQRPFEAERPFALQLHYFRSISRQRLVQTSLDEIGRLQLAGGDAATLAQWDGALRRALPDVAPGDELIGVYAPGYGMRLYNQHGLLAEIANLPLARAFFAIWLHAETRDQGLRRKLMGGRP